jgi:hypothetical protein
MKRPAIDLHIEELVLHGLAPAERYHIADAVERHLALLFAAGGAEFLSRDAEFERLNAGAFDVAPGSTPDAIGARVAQALYGGLKR